jgi:hypothetical protein
MVSVLADRLVEEPSALSPLPLRERSIRAAGADRVGGALITNDPSPDVRFAAADLSRKGRGGPPSPRTAP